MNDSLVNSKDSILSYFFKLGTNTVKLVVIDNDGGKDTSSSILNLTTLQKQFQSGILGGISAINQNYILTADTSYNSITGSSVSLLEALSAGRICICRDFPSNAEWIQHGVNGFLFNNANALANILEEISKMSAVNREEISSKARASVQDVASWEKNKNSFINFIESMARK